MQLASRRLHLSRTASRLSTFGTVLDRQEIQPIQEERTLERSPSGKLAAPCQRAASPIITPTNELPDLRVPAREQEVRSSTRSPLRQSLTSLNRPPTENTEEFEVLPADHITRSASVAGPADAGDASEDLGAAEDMETDQFIGGAIQLPRSKNSKSLCKQHEQLTYEQAAGAGKEIPECHWYGQAGHGVGRTELIRAASWGDGACQSSPRLSATEKADRHDSGIREATSGQAGVEQHTAGGHGG
ncbi:MAG: hypothetical protein BJ554DRAFT_2785 [Olpidium bornovanus]|uniref:Uncharacterized protein n=1 Tax=Olpidium bornovanus TaxID=278681 RepID=A0A8H8DGE5_9FUNG|nr:MAG: hypothetical protein BJ554DRAFT_2785 [Olpidium bornovanus]